MTDVIKHSLQNLILLSFLDEVLQQTNSNKIADSCILTLLHQHLATISQFPNKRKNAHNDLNKKTNNVIIILILIKIHVFLYVYLSYQETNIAKLGSDACLQQICHHFKDKTFEILPQLWQLISEPLVQPSQADNIEMCLSKMLAMVTLQAIVPALNEELFNHYVRIIIIQRR